MSRGQRPLFIVLLVLSLAGFGQFARNTRNVDAVALFACGVMAGAALKGLLANGQRGQPAA